MDTKALAKSKRAHSQHHSKKHHPTPTPKAPPGGTVGTGSAKKPSGKQVRDQPRQSQGSRGLPSNWDRYEDEDDSGLEGQASDSVSRTSDVIEPKSKGSDYAYLISEAKSQSQTSISSEIFPSLDDVLADLNQGVCSLLSVRGQNLLSWMEDDNFIVEDKATASHEASFLSLNLDALAEQLAKVDISKRLFIEGDLFPPELLAELQSSSNQECDQEYDLDHTTYGSEVAKRETDEIVSGVFLEGDKNVGRCSEVSLSETTISSHTASTSTVKRSKSVNRVKHELWQAGGNGQSTEQNPKSEFVANSDEKQTKQQSRFKAKAAEAELDMLLDSFSETQFLDSSGVSEKPSYVSNVPQRETSTSSLVGNPSMDGVLKNNSDLSTSAMVGPSLGDAIDDLLNATVNLKNQNSASKPHEVMAVPVSKSKVLDDFDSWLDTI